MWVEHVPLSSRIQINWYILPTHFVLYCFYYPIFGFIIITSHDSPICSLQCWRYIKVCHLLLKCGPKVTAHWLCWSLMRALSILGEGFKSVKAKCSVPLLQNVYLFKLRQNGDQCLILLFYFRDFFSDHPEISLSLTFWVCCFLNLLLFLSVGCPLRPYVSQVEVGLLGYCGNRNLLRCWWRMRHHGKLCWWSNIKGIPLQVSISLISPWKMSSIELGLVTAQSFCSILKHSPVESSQCLASLVCVPSCSPLHVGSTWPWAMKLLKATWLWRDNEWVWVTE